MNEYVEFQDNEGKTFELINLRNLNDALIKNPGDYVKDNKLFHFIKWDKDVSKINESSIVKPIYEQTDNCLVFNDKNEIVGVNKYNNYILYLPIYRIINGKKVNINTIKENAFVKLNNVVGIYIPKEISVIETLAFKNYNPINLFLERDGIGDEFEDDWNSDCITYYGCHAQDIIINDDFVYLIKNKEANLIRCLSNQIFLRLNKCVKVNGVFYDIKVLRQYAFYKQKRLEFLYVPDTVQRIYDFVVECPNVVVCFENSKVLGTGLYEEDEAPMYLGVTRDNLIIDNDFAFVIKGGYAILIKSFGNEEKVIIPREVKKDSKTFYVRKIGKRVFTNKKTKNLDLPNTIIDIYCDAFADSDIKDNFKLCSDLFLAEQEKANHGDSEACLNLAKMYKEGLGITRDIDKVKECYLKAIALGNKSANTLIGEIYMDAGEFIPAYKFLVEGEKINDGLALYYLGILYLFGFDVYRDYVKAREYFTKSMKCGEHKATEILKVLDLCGIGLQIDSDEVIRRTKEVAKSSTAAKCFLGLLLSGDNVELSLTYLYAADYDDYPFANFAYNRLVDSLRSYKSSEEIEDLIDRISNY